VIGDIPEAGPAAEPPTGGPETGPSPSDGEAGREAPRWETHARGLIREGGHGGYGAAALTADVSPAGGTAIATYVSLFLILFVFFIVLFSSARVERDRVHAVLASLDGAFGHLPSDLGILPHADAPMRSDEGFARELGQMLGQFGALGVSAVPNAEGVLTVDVPMDRLFAPGSTEIVPAATPLLDRLAVILQQSHGAGGDRGQRYRLTWQVATPPVEPPAKAPGTKPAGGKASDNKAADAGVLNETGAASTLELARGAAFAAALFARGCPGDGVAITREVAPTAAAAGLRWVFADLGAEVASGRHASLGGQDSVGPESGRQAP
jgi:hypothetical protein